MPPKFTDKTIISLSLIVAVVIVIIFMFCGYKKYEDVTYTIIKTSDENPESESDSDNDDKLEQFYGEKLLADFSSDPDLYIYKIRFTNSQIIWTLREKFPNLF